MRLRHRLTVLVVASLAAACSAKESGSDVPASSTQPVPFLTDAQGRAMILRGINVDNAAKGDPLRMPHIDQTDVERIAKGWGFDFVRLLVFWDALEPQPGQIDQAYIDRVIQRIDSFAAAGVSVLVDMHQDVYGVHFASDGAPDWATADDGLPFKSQTPWSLSYLEPGCERAFDNFWPADGPHPELQQHYAAAWKALATRLAGHAGVVGYDLMNEPFPGSDFNGAEALFRTTPEDGGTSAQFDRTKLGPFYQRVVEAIREVDADSWIFFEPRYGAPGNGSPSFLPVLSDPRSGEPRLVYAPHLYSTAAEANGAYAKGDKTVSFWEAERSKEIAQQGCPLVLGEWGFAWSTTDAPRYMADVLAMADRLGAGWAYWSYDAGGPGSWGLFDRTTGADNPSADLAVRPYPRRIAGAPGSFSYDPASRTFDLTFDDKPGVTGPTEIYVPGARHYADGWTLTVDSDPAGAWSQTWDAEREIASVTTSAQATTHHVRIVPGKAP